MPPSQAPKTRPIVRFAEAAGKCTAEGSAYGKCIMAEYNNVYQDKCAKEFLRLKECYMAHAKKGR